MVHIPNTQDVMTVLQENEHSENLCSEEQEKRKQSCDVTVVKEVRAACLSLTLLKNKNRDYPCDSLVPYFRSKSLMIDTAPLLYPPPKRA